MGLAHTIIGEGAPYLFMHGLGADKRQSIDLLEEFTKQMPVQAIMPDFRGHGDSLDADEEKLNFDSFADDAVALLDELGIEKAHVGGLSMGSGVTINMALRYPERVQSLTILRPSWLDETCPSHLSIVARVGEWIDAHGLEVAEQKLNEDAEFIELTEREPNVAASIPPLFGRPQAIESAKVLYRMFQSRPYESLSLLKNIGKPAIVLDTTHDDLHPLGVAQQTAAAFGDDLFAHETLPPRYLEKAAYSDAGRAVLQKFLKSVGV